MPPPPRKKNGAAIAAMSIVGAVLAIGLVVILAVGLSGKGDTDSADDGSSSASHSSTSSSAPSPSDSDSQDTGSSGDKLTSDEYADDWNFKLGDVKLDAKHVKGWDYDDCGGFEVDSALTDLGCEYGVEVAYRAKGGDLMVTNLFLGMSDEGSAEAAGGKDRQISDDDWKPESDSYIHDFGYGKFVTDAVGDIVVLTFCTAKSSVDEGTADDYLDYMNSDMAGALEFR